MAVLTAQRVAAQARKLPEDELLRLHREVCRMAAAIYWPRYKAKWRAHYDMSRAVTRR